MSQTEPIHIQVHPVKSSRDKIADCIESGGFLTVAEGSVRSGKTCTLLMAFAVYVIRSEERTFLLSGRTVKTAEQNCILEQFGLLNLIPGSEYRKVGESRAVVFHVRTPRGIVTKKIIVMGASDIRSYMALRGQTFGGWMADEVNMHDPEFVAEALRRTAVSKDRRHYFSLNPGAPKEWIYTDYLDRYEAMSDEEREQLGGYHYFHFTPDDNPAMTPQMLASLKAQYPEGSHLYRRYVLGERCVAEGLVYPNVSESSFMDFDIADVDIRYCAIDFGATHPTVMVLGGPYNGNKRDWRIVAEYFDEASGKTTYDHYCGFLDVCRRIGADPNRIRVAIDPAARTLRDEFVKHGLQPVKAKNDVLPGIEFTRELIRSGRLLFHDTLQDILGEFRTYAWDPKASETGQDKPIKLGDDRMDAIRYFTYTFVRPLIGLIG